MEMEDLNIDHNQYGMDLRQFISGSRPPQYLPSIPSPDHLFSFHRNLHYGAPAAAYSHHCDMMMLMPPGGGGSGLHAFISGSTAAVACHVPSPAATTGCGIPGAIRDTVSAATNSAALSGLEAEGGCAFGGGHAAGNGRWPRQETLTLLDIRSRLDSKFKEANQKGPFWDEVSRIMFDEHGYQRTGKKCREKFENLYKYHKKTKEVKAGRQDGKHYRFFRQLEALCGELRHHFSPTIPDTRFVGNNNNNLGFHVETNTDAHPNQDAFHSRKHCDNLSFSNSSAFDTCSSEENGPSSATLMENDSTEKRRKRRDGRGWKMKIKEFVGLQVRKLIERQEEWLETLTKSLEQKEQERILREEEWRKQQFARIDSEYRFWAKERTRIEARDAALMEVLQKYSAGRDQVGASSPDQSKNLNINNVQSDHSLQESELTRLMQLRSSMESKFHQRGGIEEEEDALREETTAKKACIGYERSALACKEKCHGFNNDWKKTKECSNKNKPEENPRQSFCNFRANEECLSSPANSNPGIGSSDICCQLLMSDGENLWENYELKFSKAGDQNNPVRSETNTNLTDSLFN